MRVRRRSLFFIDPELTIHNSKAIVSSGPPSVVPRIDGKGFDAAVSPQARDGDLISVVLLVPRKRPFVYTIPVATPPSPPRSKASRPRALPDSPCADGLAASR